MSQTPDFDDEMDHLQGHLPDWAGRRLGWLRQRHLVWVRLPAGLAFTAGGVLSFLPVLGIWMLPLGLALLAVDVPPMRRPMAHALRFANGRIEKRANGKRAKQEAPSRR